VADIIETAAGADQARLLNTGDGSLVAFMCPEKSSGVPTEWATDINSAQGLPGALYHFAFHCDDVRSSKPSAKADRKGIEVTAVVTRMVPIDLFSRSQRVLLEYCATVARVHAEDKIMRHHDQPGPMVSDLRTRRKVHRITDGAAGCEGEIARRFERLINGQEQNLKSRAMRAVKDPHLNPLLTGRGEEILAAND